MARQIVHVWLGCLQGFEPTRNALRGNATNFISEELYFGLIAEPDDRTYNSAQCLLKVAQSTSQSVSRPVSRSVSASVKQAKW
jgi:hypothetical protein